MLGFDFSEGGIPHECPCGETIIVERTNEHARNKIYFKCRVYKNDGLHRKTSWDQAIQGECENLKCSIEEMEKKIELYKAEVAMLKKEMWEQNAVVVKLVERVEKYFGPL